MNDVLGKMAAIVMSALLMFIAPVYIMANRMDQSAQTYMDNAVQEFVDNVRATGIIRADEYEKLADSLDGIQPCCDINIVISMKQSIPAADGVFTYYKDVYTGEILDIMYPGEASVYLSEGDYIQVTVKTTQPTMAQRMFSSDKYVPLFFTYGGQIGDGGKTS